ncbi:MAG: hypothetical protein LIP09_00785 [Bacteroidales bacterium]|nr:hypothetical protein [Bacteroidales bacterium]
MPQKIEIILDADVVIHFSEAECLPILCDIFPDCEYIVLNLVYDEIIFRRSLRTYFDNWLKIYHKRIRQEEFNPKGIYMKEFMRLRSQNLGRGESACMVYCLEHHGVLGSSNLKDILDFCNANGLTYLTTIDFLYYAYMKKLMTSKDCDEFIRKVKSKGSKLPDIDITKYPCKVII